jgi:hypothetical protein
MNFDPDYFIRLYVNEPVFREISFFAHLDPLLSGPEPNAAVFEHADGAEMGFIDHKLRVFRVSCESNSSPNLPDGPGGAATSERERRGEAQGRQNHWNEAFHLRLHPIVRRFLGDDDIVHMTFPKSLGCGLYKARSPGAEGLDIY